MSINKLREFTKYFNDFYSGEDSIYNLTPRIINCNEIIEGLKVLGETVSSFMDDSITREALRYVIFDGADGEQAYSQIWL